MITLPYDWSLIADGASPDLDIRWPTNADEFRSIINGHLRGILELAASSDDDMHSSTLLMSIIAMSPVWAFCEKAICVQHETDAAIRFSGSSEVFPYLRGDTSIPDNIGAVPIRILQPPPPRHPFVRSVINTSRMTKWWNIPAAFLTKGVEVGTMNSLLAEFSLRDNGPCRFRDSNHALIHIRQSTKAEENPRIEGLVLDQLENLVVGSLPLDAPLAARLSALVRRQLKPYVNLILRDLSQMERTKTKIPRTYWGGSGGKYSTRMMSLECMRRGGSVTRFDHAGSLGFMNLPELFATVELVTSNRYVMATKSHAALAKKTGAPELTSPLRSVDIVGGPGYGHIRKLALTGSAARSGKLRVMYLSSFSNSETKSAIHFLSQIIYQDWSMRLARKLSALPIDLVCKPHPDFRYSGAHHPLSQFATIVHEPFEQVINDADVFIFDCLNSTTFWEAVCTDKRIICIDVGLAHPTDAARPILERRCKFIQASFDDANRLRIDDATLEDAVLGGTQSPRPDELQEILIGP